MGKSNYCVINEQKRLKIAFSRICLAVPCAYRFRFNTIIFSEWFIHFYGNIDSRWRRGNHSLLKWSLSPFFIELLILNQVCMYLLVQYYLLKSSYSMIICMYILYLRYNWLLTAMYYYRKYCNCIENLLRVLLLIREHYLRSGSILISLMIIFFSKFNMFSNKLCVD